MTKKEFWIRFPIYVLFGVIIPVVFLIVRFDLFSQINSVSIGGWGIVVILFICIFFSSVMTNIEKGLQFSFFKQMMTGLRKIIIPLIAIAFVIYYMQDCMKELFQFLLVCIASETIAIIVNPLPKWTNENKIEQDKQNLQSIIESLKK